MLLKFGNKLAIVVDIPPCPTLRYLSITHLINADNVLMALFQAIQTGHMPKLNYLDISGCSFQANLAFPVQFPSESLILCGVKGIALQSINKLKTLWVYLADHLVR